MPWESWAGQRYSDILDGLTPELKQEGFFFCVDGLQEGCSLLMHGLYLWLSLVGTPGQHGGLRDGCCTNTDWAWGRDIKIMTMAMIQQKKIWLYFLVRTVYVTKEY